MILTMKKKTHKMSKRDQTNEDDEVQEEPVVETKDEQQIELSDTTGIQGHLGCPTLTARWEDMAIKMLHCLKFQTIDTCLVSCQLEDPHSCWDS